MALIPPPSATATALKVEGKGQIQTLLAPSLFEPRRGHGHPGPQLVRL